MYFRTPHYVLLFLTSRNIFLFVKNNKTDVCEVFDFEDIVTDINTATNTNFDYLEFYEISSYIPIVFDKSDELIFAINEEKTEYFLILKNFNKDELEELKRIVDSNSSNMKIGNNLEYVYIIYSKENNSIIEGIIRSYLYC